MTTRFYIEDYQGNSAYFTSRAQTERGIVKAAERAMKEKYGFSFEGDISICDIFFRRPNWGRGPAFRYDGSCVNWLGLDWEECGRKRLDIIARLEGCN